MRQIYPNDEVSLALIKQDMTYVKDTVKDIKSQLQNEYVTKDQFEPIKRIVYGLVALMLSAVVIAILNLIINK